MSKHRMYSKYFKPLIIKIEGYNGTFDVTEVPPGVTVLIREEDKNADDERYVDGVRNFAVVNDSKDGTVDIDWPSEYCKGCMRPTATCACQREDE